MLKLTDIWELLGIFITVNGRDVTLGRRLNKC